MVLGGVLTRLWWGGDPDEIDPFSGMSRRDVYLVRKSWTRIYAEASKHGHLIFARLFQKDPITKTFFKYLSSVSEEQLPKNNVFKAHVVFLMSSLNAAVENLNSPEVVAPLMVKLGRSHHRLHIQRVHFMELRDVLIDILINDLKFGDDVVQAWGRFVQFIYKHIFTIVTE